MEKFEAIITKDAYCAADDNFEGPNTFLIKLDDEAIELLKGAQQALMQAKEAIGQKKQGLLNCIEMSISDSVLPVEIYSELSDDDIEEELMQAASLFESKEEYIQRNLQPWDGRWTMTHVKVSEDRFEFGCYEKYTNTRIYSAPLTLGELQQVATQSAAFKASTTIEECFEQPAQGLSQLPQRKKSLGM